jgi:exopolysaccharide production protein ExoQ
MPAKLALLLWIVACVWLFARDRKLRPMTSGALWIPLLWLIVVGTRPVTAWFGGETQAEHIDEYLNGSPIDATIYLMLIVAASFVLLTRRLGSAAASNKWFFVFTLYCLISVAWSAYPFVASKRWLKDFGTVLMVLIMFTEENPVLAVRAVLARYSYVAVPLSIVLIKYYPDLGRTMSRWTWDYMYCGVATDKNSLGAIAALCGVFLGWDFLETRLACSYARRAHAPSAKAPRPSSPNAIAAVSSRTDSVRKNLSSRTHAVTENASSRGWDERSAFPCPNSPLDAVTRFLLMGAVVWVLNKAQSSTAQMCLMLGLAAVFLLRSSARKRGKHLGAYSLLAVPLIVLAYSTSSILADVVGMLGRDTTLTGRTDLWADLLAAPINRVLGSGYGSFWLGDTARALWQKYYFHPNQAHNGYLETYLNQGLVGVALLVSMLLGTFGKLRKQLQQGGRLASLSFSFLAIGIVSNWTEATINTLTPVWFMLVLAALSSSISYSASAGVDVAPARNAGSEYAR